MKISFIRVALFLAVSAFSSAATVNVIQAPANPRGHSTAIIAVTKPNERGQVGLQVNWYQSYKVRTLTYRTYSYYMAARYTPGIGVELLSNAAGTADYINGITADGSVYGSSGPTCSGCAVPPGRIWSAPGVFIDKPASISFMNGQGDYVAGGVFYDRAGSVIPIPPGSIAAINDSRELAGSQVFEPISNNGNEQAPNADGTGWFLPGPLPVGQIGWPAPVSILGGEQYVAGLRNNGLLALVRTSHPYYTVVWSGVASRVCQHGQGFDSRGILYNVPVNYVCTEYPDVYLAGTNDFGDAVGGLFSYGAFSAGGLFQAAWIGGVQTPGATLVPGWGAVSFKGINNARQISGLGQLNGQANAFLIDTVAAATFSLTPASLTFASQLTFQPGAAQNATLSNISPSPLPVMSIVTTGDFAQNNTCPSTLAASQTCSISVTFTPTATGARTGSLNLSLGGAPFSGQVALSGSGLGQSLGASPTNVVMSTAAGASITASVTITNVAPTASPVAISVSGASFSQTNNCPASLGANLSCVVTIQFAPASAATYVGTLTATGAGGTQTVPLSGTGTKALVVSPTSVTMSAVSGASSTATVTITNVSPAASPVAVALTGASFSQTNNCPASLAANQGCAVTIQFAPIAAVAYSGALTATGAGGSQAVTLSGSGATVALVIAPASVDFGSVQVRDNPTRIITVSNPTALSFGLSSIQTSGAGFTLKTKSCGTTLAAGLSCTVTIEFAPVLTVPYSGSVRITDSSGAVNQVALSGLGTP